MTATSANPIGTDIAATFGVKIDFGGWLLASCVPSLATILTLPLFLRWIHPPEARGAVDAQAMARRELSSLGRLSRDERIVAVVFVLLVTGWVLGPKLKLDSTAVSFLGLGALLVTRVLTLEDLAGEGDTLVMFFWLAILFAMSAQLNELGFMGYVGERLARQLAGLSWPATFVALSVLYVLMHYLFVSQSAQVLALLGVFADVGIRSGVPAPLMIFTLLFASSWFSTITPQGGTQNIIFVGSGYLTQRECYRLGALTTLYCLVLFLALGTPWLLLVAR
jgi:DASS family divalent anion:Na+ symporter